MKNDKDFWTTSEISEKTGIHVRTVVTHMNNGDLPGIKLGQLWLCPKWEWAEYVAGTWTKKQASNV